MGRIDGRITSLISCLGPYMSAKQNQVLSDIGRELADANKENAALRGQLEAERDKYRREVYGQNNEGDPIGGDPPAGLYPQLTAARGQLDDCRAQVKRQAEMLAAAQKDAERYRWLRDEALEGDWQMLENTAYPYWDEVIDATRAQEKK